MSRRNNTLLIARQKGYLRKFDESKAEFIEGDYVPKQGEDDYYEDVGVNFKFAYENGLSKEVYNLFNTWQTQNTSKTIFVSFDGTVFDTNDQITTNDGTFNILSTNEVIFSSRDLRGLGRSKIIGIEIG